MTAPNGELLAVATERAIVATLIGRGAADGPRWIGELSLTLFHDRLCSAILVAAGQVGSTSPDLIAAWWAANAAVYSWTFADLADLSDAQVPPGQLPELVARLRSVASARDAVGSLVAAAQHAAKGDVEMGAAMADRAASAMLNGATSGEEQHTDLGMARRFLSRHAADYRFALGDWYRWDGARWAAGTGGSVRHEIACIARSVVIACGADNIQANKARSAEKSGRIVGAAAVAADDPRVRVDGPNPFDAQPMLLACTNAVVDLKTGHSRAARREDMLSRAVPHDYDPDARCPRWERFVAEVMDGDAEMIAFLRRWCGYCITGDVSEHSLVIATGSGRNGKGTLVEMLMHVLGPDFSAAAPEGLLLASKNERHPTELTELRGRRLIVASEVDKSASFSESRIKRLTGGDSVSARRMGENFSVAPATHKFIILVNRLPTVRDRSPAFWARINVVPFPVSFRGREDFGLIAALRSESVGILAWLVRAAVEWSRARIGKASAVREATAAYSDDEDALGRFLATYKPGEERALKTIHEAFKLWCLAENLDEPKGGKSLAGDLAEHGWKRRKIATGALWSDSRATKTEETATVEPEQASFPSDCNEPDRHGFTEEGPD